MDVIQTMPGVAALLQADFTARQWLTYYRNLWTRNLIARTIDVQQDITLKAKDADQQVRADDGSGDIAVKFRLEARKILVQDAVNLLKNLEIVIAADNNAALADTYWSEKALAVAEDVLPKKEEPEIGSPCEVDGKKGVWMKQGDAMVCAVPPPAEEKKTGEAEPGKEAGV